MLRLPADRVPHVVLAPDKFKGSLSAAEVAATVADAFAQAAAEVGREVRTTEVPVADGGEGTVEAALAAGWRPLTRVVSGPTGRVHEAVLARRGEDALVEMAQADGLDRLPDGLAPLTAGTRGTGELVRSALDDGARRVVLAVGGSASTDGGAGMLQALGARLLDAAGRELPGGGGALLDLARVDLDGLDPRLAGVGWTLAADVDNPLLGPRGAAAVFGPQKGADPRDVERLDAGLARLADALAAAGVPEARDLPGAGAAGGLGLPALGLFGARRRPGIDVVLELAGFAGRAADADLVVTGEGSFDEQSLGGKTPVGVARAAAAAGAPVVVLSGRRALTEDRWRAAGFAAAIALTDLGEPAETCVAQARPLLHRVALDLARDLLRP
ncbi:glycerate kinase [Kineococcus gynurae]|uniref:Glycerate kinase n=1 Tax=Kineococcus gynurae TaxID=452979 RepID=A0ABV5LW27_9ACTN